MKMKLCFGGILLLQSVIRISAAGCVDEAGQCANYALPDCKTDSYTGDKATTVSGRTCQNWNSQTPHVHSYATVGDHNRCRNPSGSHISPWCYTTDSKTRWEDCFPSCCVAHAGVANKECAIYGSSKCKSQTGYEGTKTSSQHGNTCENWSTQGWNPALRTTGNHNKCRNANGEMDSPWCIVGTVASATTGDVWERCFPSCCFDAAQTCFKGGDKPECKAPDAYLGTKSQTVSEKTCQKWTSQAPHTHKYAMGGDHNYCRALAGYAPWCFTTDAGTKWEYCFNACA